MNFLKYQLTSDLLCLGETPQIGILKPCSKTIRYSSITGALRKKFGISNIHAVGYLTNDDGFNQVDFLTYAPRERSVSYSKLPLQIEFLSNVKGYVYIPIIDDLKLPEKFEITMGAFLTKGFGICKLLQEKIISDKEGKIIYNPFPDKYILNVRIPEKYISIFQIEKIVPIYGYLFEPESTTKGEYVRSLFEGSIVKGPLFLLKKGA